MTTRRFDTEAIRREHPLVEEMSASGIALLPAGAGQWQARCPFHADHRPSLRVYGADQHFHCFACGAHGDVIDFVMRRDNLRFADACSRLASSESTTSRPMASSGKTRLRRRRLSLGHRVVLNLACAVYRRRLWDYPRALEYLRARGLSEATIRACALGYADGYSLTAALRRFSDSRPARLATEFSAVRLLALAGQVGLLRPTSHGTLREFLAGRIVVPEIRAGQCIWFIGRRIDDRPAPKYLALPGRRPVLGLERAARQRQVVVCEGVFDYLTAVEWGLPAFSPCGTHISGHSLSVLSRAEVVYGAFDGDPAGRVAPERLAELLGERFRPLALPDGQDLNDLGRQPDGLAQLDKLMAASCAGLAERPGEAALRPRRRVARLEPVEKVT